MNSLLSAGREVGTSDVKISIFDIDCIPIRLLAEMQGYIQPHIATYSPMAGPLFME